MKSTTALLPFLSVLSFASAAGQVPDPIPPGAYNLVIVVLDDVGVDRLAVYNPVSAASTPCNYADMPSLSTFAANGVRFSRTFVNPLCSPTRANILTGQYGFRTGVRSYINDVASGALQYELPRDRATIPDLLKLGFGPGGVRYSTGAFGKWHLGFPYSPMPAQWSDCHPICCGFDTFKGSWTNNEDSHVISQYLSLSETTCGLIPAAPCSTANGYFPLPTGTKDATRVREDAVNWINSQTSPAFAYIAFNPPHAAIEVPDHTHLSSCTLQALTAMLSDGTVAPLPAGSRVVGNSVIESTGVVLPLLNPIYFTQVIHKAMLEWVDDELQTLLTGIGFYAPGNDTMVIIIGDNGTPANATLPPFSPTHAKGTLYQGGLQVPLIVAGPYIDAIDRGKECDELISGVDLWLTSAQLGGLSAAQAMAQVGSGNIIDSKSFLSLLEDPDGAEIRSHVFSERGNKNGLQPVGVPSFGTERAVQTKNFKFIARYTVDFTTIPPTQTPYGTPPTEFYYLVTDPRETINLAALGIPTRFTADYLKLKALEATLGGP